MIVSMRTNLAMRLHTKLQGLQREIFDLFKALDSFTMEGMLDAGDIGCQKETQIGS